MAIKLQSRWRRLLDQHPVWQDEDDLDNLAFDPPRESLKDHSDCPIAPACDGCGATAGLRVATSMFSRPGGGYDVACATVCEQCAGRPFLFLLTERQLRCAFDAHSTHLPRA
ncbi:MULTISPECIES: hypothetical protein [Amycolatopsis]|uniref:Ferredoxin n=1 Tax=Amycolatopsis tucumanensis TaxID=401106 RepID=A0ABP7HNZ1_9PSEU|nr:MULTISPECIES: hypothetical protein [Amycolatopsis]MCF6421048.1 hypothetical protein [Amycolatopsis tucumanensis]